MTRLRIGVDVGGTFTDHILFDEESGILQAFKTPSTPHNPSRSVMDGVDHFCGHGAFRVEGSLANGPRDNG